jgi:phosphatidylglycerol:prolipoprotein diacylglycerol transferase
VIIAAYLWRMATKAANGAGSHGEIISSYLIWTGVARFLVEFIRINPKVFYGLTNAQVVSLVSIVAGVIVFLRIRNRLPARKEENRIAGRAG